ncbi:MAG: HlyD family efflux transporter periplasmic adaptor subunit [Spirulina sp. SIO3F2]|nr:HlyD family efflux transporter periplasmic adaptor subunit [Spirulina sp. SIO3F2]
MKRYWIIIIFAVGLVSGAIATSALRSRPVNSEDLAESERETELQPTQVSALGRLEPQGKVIQLAPPANATGARVETLRVKAGDWVHPNQVIAVLDSYDERQAQLREAETRVSQAQAKLNQVRAGSQQGEIDAQAATISRLQAQAAEDVQAQADQITRLEAEYNNAVAEHERHQMLYDAGAVTASRRDETATTMTVALARLREAQDVQDKLVTTGRDRVREAQANLERITEVRPVDVSVAQTDVANAIAAQRRAEVTLKQSLIRAPVAGQILQILTRPGEAIAAEGVATLGRTDVMYAIAEVYEADISRVEVGQRATITSEYGGFSGELSGVVETVGPTILNNSLFDTNPTSQSEVRVVEVAIRLTKEDGEQVSQLTNLQVRVRIRTSGRI